MRKSITTGLIALFAIVMCAANVQAQNATSGTAGPLTWKYDTGTKTLTISGQGEMPNYTWKDKAPWQEHTQKMQILVVEEGITRIGNQAFENAGNLISVTLPKTVTRIGNDAFGFCGSLPMVTIPAGVTRIGDRAFTYCSNLAMATLPVALQEIGENAFAQCRKLTSVAIPAEVKTIGAGAFAGCSNVSAITVETGNADYVVVDGVLFNKEKTTFVQYPAGRVATSYVIPTGVTSINSWAFANCSKLTSITIPATVKTIGANVFGYCQELAEIKVEAANTAYTSADGVLFDKAKKTLIKYPERRNATAYAIPAEVTNIESYAFEYTKNLTSITIPTSVKKIGFAAFASSVLTSVVIPDGVDTISRMTFRLCLNLRSVTLPASIKMIGFGAFMECKKLEEMTVKAKTPPIVDNLVFEGVPVANVTLTVPKGAKAAYAAAPVWKEFKQIAESTVSNALLPETRIYTADGRLYLTLPNAASVRIYNLNGTLVRNFTAPAGETSITLPQGVYVVRAGERTEKVVVQ